MIEIRSILVGVGLFVNRVLFKSSIVNSLNVLTNILTAIGQEGRKVQSFELRMPMRMEQIWRRSADMRTRHDTDPRTVLIVGGWGDKRRKMLTV